MFHSIYICTIKFICFKMCIVRHKKLVLTTKQAVHSSKISVLVMIPVYYCQDVCNMGNNMHKNLIIAWFNSPMVEGGGGGKVR